MRHSQSKVNPAKFYKETNESKTIQNKELKFYMKKIGKLLGEKYLNLE